MLQIARLDDEEQRNPAAGVLGATRRIAQRKLELVALVDDDQENALGRGESRALGIWFGRRAHSVAIRFRPQALRKGTLASHPATIAVATATKP